ncbi:hypothetical protein VY88_25895 [Azospirillum thiophilum]|uniref:Uncharacterized protein n=1 Tax=Azospirillum thiophilum TaxID=528244 RepID=A0AAC8ZWF7_9PROT|nr:hypothetical protein AL072_28815 [Azospirillum thiophilum]KJR62381.1 hypothetical protein VY88_25895 [Azospirillum thiophilum]
MASVFQCECCDLPTARCRRPASRQSGTDAGSPRLLSRTLFAPWLRGTAATNRPDRGVGLLPGAIGAGAAVQSCESLARRPLRNLRSTAGPMDLHPLSAFAVRR